MGKFCQFVSTGLVCYLSICLGLMFAWPSSTLRNFQSENTTLSRPMTVTELSLFGSLSSIGALISTPLAGFMLGSIGRKNSNLVFSLAQVIAWSLISTFRQVEVVLTAVFISGAGAGVILVTPIYIGEFCQESIRGAMTSGPLIFYNLGMLVSYLLGGFLAYDAMIYSCLTMSAVAVVFICLMKESPIYLMQKGREEEAAKNIAFFRSTTVNSNEVQEEMNCLRQALNPELDEPTEEEEKLKSDPKDEKVPAQKETLSTLQFVKKSQSTRRALAMCLVLCTSSVFQGIIVVQVYAEPLFEEAIPTIPATLCSILFAALSTSAGIMGGYLSDLAGRKTLLIYSSLGSSICTALLGSQIHIHWAPHAFTAVCIYMFCIVFTLGIGLIPYVLVAEVFLPEVKGFVGMLCMEWLWLCSFVMLFIFNPLVEAIGLGPTFYVFSTIAAATTVYSIFYVPETKGLAVNDIQKLFETKKSNKYEIRA